MKIRKRKRRTDQRNYSRIHKYRFSLKDWKFEIDAAEFGLGMRKVAHALDELRAAMEVKE